MTEDELDLLASAYLDGEATSEEVAMVEREPQLQARVEELRVVSERLSAPVNAPPHALQEQQLAAALAAFTLDTGNDARPDAANDAGNEASGAHAATGPAAEHGGDPDVIDLTARSRETASGRRRKPRRSDQQSTVTELPSRSMPKWLPAAAALLLLGGGGAFLISQASTGSLDDETAAESSSGDAADSAEVFAADESSDVAGSSETELTELDAEEMEDEETTEALAENGADDATEESAGEDSGDADRAEAAPADSAGQGDEGGFFPEEPVLSFAQIPSAADLPEELPQLRQDLALSRCGGTLELSDSQSIDGYLPIEIAGELAELFILVDGAGEQAVAIVSEGCELRE